MKKRTLTLLFGLLTLGATGHFLWAQTTGGGNALNSPDSIHSRFTVEQGTHGVMAEFTVHKNGPFARLDIEVRNFNARQCPGYSGTEVPHTAELYVNGLLWAATTPGGGGGTLDFSIPQNFLGGLLGLPAVYELKVYNANYEQVFFTSFDGILS